MIRKNRQIALLCYTGIVGLFAPAQSQNPFAEIDSLSMVFELGEVQVVGRRSHPFTLILGNESIRSTPEGNLSGALNTLPGINLVQLGPKNETMVNVRGFDLRQVPVCMDGVPVYVSFDGYADLDRFLVSDLARITVARGEASVLTGPNSMGGSINLVSRKPVSLFELETAAGFIMDRMGMGGVQSDLNIGTRRDRYYMQAGLSFRERKPFVIPGIDTSSTEKEGMVLPNSQQQDLNASVKFGWTPNATDSYVVSYNFQDGSKGVPAYAGKDPFERRRYWQFPEIRKSAIHLNTKTMLGRESHLQTRWFYNSYFSDLRSYDDSTLTSRNMPSSFTSIYDDGTLGGTVICSLKPFEKHELKVAMHTLYDHHREGNIYPVEESVRHFRDITWSMGIEDEYRISDKLIARNGAGIHLKSNLQADDYLAQTDSVFDFPSHNDGALDILAGLSYELANHHHLHTNLSRKSRFPTMKDRYSYRLGKSYPNPGLVPENAWNLDAGYAFIPGTNFQFRTSLFFSRLQNTIQAVYGVEATDNSVYQYQNTGNARFYGWESDLTFSPFRGGHVGMQYTFVERENLSHPEIRFTDVPRHKTSIHVNYNISDLVDMNWSGLYNSPRTRTSDGRYQTDAFFTMDFRMVLHLLYFSLETGVTNLLDASYSFMEGYPAPGRRAMMGIRYTFKGKPSAGRPQ